MRCRPLLLAWAALSAAPASAQIRSVTLHPPARDFAYAIGDVFAVEAEILAGPGSSLAADSLPVPGPVTPAIDITGVEVFRAPTAEATRFVIRISYQSFFAPEQPTQTQAPGYGLTILQGGTRIAAKIPAWPFYTAPFRADRDAPPELSALRPDHAAHPRSLVALRAELVACLMAALAAGLVFGHARGWLASLRAPTKPFARASRRIASTLRGPAGDDAYADAMRELHRAFDATATHSLLPGDLDSFLAGHGKFRPLRADIEHFFAVSRTFFFASEHARAGRPISADWLLALGRRLRRAERA